MGEIQAYGKIHGRYTRESMDIREDARSYRMCDKVVLYDVQSSPGRYKGIRERYRKLQEDNGTPGDISYRGDIFFKIVSNRLPLEVDSLCTYRRVRRDIQRDLGTYSGDLGRSAMGDAGRSMGGTGTR
jgi:hypothetical protein